MRCTSCSQYVKPVVAIDIDGTLADYHTAFCQFAHRYWGLPLSGHECSSRCQWNGEGDFEDHIGLDRPAYREAKLAYRQGGNKRWLKTYPGSKELITKVRLAGAEVWIATTRPWQRLDNIDPDTREWLRRHNITVDGLLYGDDKYLQLLETVDKGRIVGAVEDLPEQFDKASSLGISVIQALRNHNSGPGQSRTPRGTLDVCTDWVVHQIEEWKKTYER